MRKGVTSSAVFRTPGTQEDVAKKTKDAVLIGWKSDEKRKLGTRSPVYFIGQSEGRGKGSSASQK